MLQPSLLVALLLLLLHLEHASGKPPTKELPRPLIPLHDQEREEQLQPELEAKATFQSTRNGRSRRPTLMDVALQQSVRQGLDAMTELYGRIQPEMLRNGQTLQDNHPAAMLSRFNAPTTDSERREMAAYATIAAAKAFRKK
uniref:GG11317 n=1 Tax=Drosophila erecta TaxID=7220 RepID=B3P6Z3_DROER